jgi:hypothetical protein
MPSRMPVTLEDVAYRLLPRVGVGRALSNGEWTTLARVADGLLANAPTKIASDEVADNVESFLIAGRSLRAWRVRVLLTLIALSTLPSTGRRFGALTIEERRALIEEKWSGGTYLWRVCSKVRNLVILGAYGDRRAASATGYVPLPLRPRFKHLRDLEHARAEELA